MNNEHSTQVALLYYGRTYHRKALRLVEELANETLILSSDCVDESLSEAVVDCDLIIIEANDHLTAHQQQALHWIRAGSLAPIVVLIDEKEREDSLTIIESGVDAVIPLHLASDAIVAHCQALMRRWRSHPYAIPKFA
jgi:DNA-binding response OmpR family regulator